MNKRYPYQGSFLDPQLIKDESGREILYAPYRFKQIVQERYLISKSINTSYNELGEITPAERKYLLEFIVDEIQKEKEKIEQIKKNSK